MKYLLLLAIMSISSTSFSQNIEERKLDPFDSIMTIKSNQQPIGKMDLSSYSNPNIWAQVIRQIKINKKKYDVTSCFITVNPDHAVIFDETTSIKIMFEDGVVETFKNEAPRKVYAKDEVATIYFKVPKSSLLRTKKIKSAKFTTDSMEIITESSEVSAQCVMRMIELVEAEKILK